MDTDGDGVKEDLEITVDDVTKTTNDTAVDIGDNVSNVDVTVEDNNTEDGKASLTSKDGDTISVGDNSENVSVTVDGVDIKAGDNASAINIGENSKDAEVTIKDSTVTAGANTDKQTTEGNTDKLVDDATVNISEGADSAKVTLDNATITAGNEKSAVAVQSDDAQESKATITIKNEVEVTGGRNGAGIEVNKNSDVTIEGDGKTGTSKLTATGNGGNETEAKLADNGKSITNAAECGTSGAGIGGAKTGIESGYETYNDKGSDNGSSGSITISGISSLIAKGFGMHAAGVGGAFGGTTGDITIKDTTVTEAKGGYADVDEAGNSHEQSLVDSKTKYQGQAEAEGGAAIGGGGKGQSISTITIDNSEIVSAIGGNKAAAIGSGTWDNGDNAGDGLKATSKITINKSILHNVYGGSSASGIGTGRLSKGYGTKEFDIEIIDSTIENVTGGEFGAGIGTGSSNKSVTAYSYSSPDTISTDSGMVKTNISIKGSTINAYGGNGGAGIGGGYQGSNVHITIADSDSGNHSNILAVGGVVYDRSDSSKSWRERGASAIGTGAEGSGLGKYIDTSINIDAGQTVVAISSGAKWAIDLGALNEDRNTITVDGETVTRTNVNVNEKAYQNLFLTSETMNTNSGADKGAKTGALIGITAADTDAGTQLAPYTSASGWTVNMSGKTVTIPANYLSYTPARIDNNETDTYKQISPYICVAVVSPDLQTTDSTYRTTSDSATYSQMATAASDSYASMTTEDIQNKADRTNMGSGIGGNLLSNSFKYVALRGDAVEKTDEEKAKEEAEKKAAEEEAKKKAEEEAKKKAEEEERKRQEEEEEERKRQEEEEKKQQEENTPDPVVTDPTVTDPTVTDPTLDPEVVDPTVDPEVVDPSVEPTVPETIEPANIDEIVDLPEDYQPYTPETPPEGFDVEDMVDYDQPFEYDHTKYYEQEHYVINDEGVPLGVRRGWSQTDEGVWIFDDSVPLAAKRFETNTSRIPATGDENLPWGLVAALAGLGLVGFTVPYAKKRREQ